MKRLFTCQQLRAERDNLSGPRDSAKQQDVANERESGKRDGDQHQDLGDQVVSISCQSFGTGMSSTTSLTDQVIVIVWDFVVLSRYSLS